MCPGDSGAIGRDGFQHKKTSRRGATKVAIAASCALDAQGRADAAPSTDGLRKR
ncbi:hypothetical protein GLE_2021 [Lysobacter enzymogenes]|uniref:Uncharacterized protein n=1 Tax=Lysobacter enzymogenes TaxID=69 RepID=A0A0S2DFG4_LYSEN|nr:hypothetical protein GLE_2021 [Lysobacter enzymogenes]